MRPWSHTEGRGILVGTAGPREVRFRTRRLPFNGAGDMEAGFLAFADHTNKRFTHRSKLCIPHLVKSPNPHILNISPPLNMRPRWFKDHVAYTMAKYGMSMCVLGMTEEFRAEGIACNALWPRTAIITAAMEMLGGNEVDRQCRKPEIMADAAYVMLCKDSRSYTGNFAIDDEVLKNEGITNFDEYAIDPSASLIPDFFLDDFDDFAAKQSLQLDSSGKITQAKVDADEGQVAQVFANIEKTDAQGSLAVENDDAANLHSPLSTVSTLTGPSRSPCPTTPTCTPSSQVVDLPLDDIAVDELFAPPRPSHDVRVSSLCVLADPNEVSQRYKGAAVNLSSSVRSCLVVGVGLRRYELFGTSSSDRQETCDVGLVQVLNNVNQASQRKAETLDIMKLDSSRIGSVTEEENDNDCIVWNLSLPP
nr:uncharacterized protein LOC113826780 [Penaeus vannamei]